MTDEDLKALFETNAAETRRVVDEANAETRRLLSEAIAETQRHIDHTNTETRAQLGGAIDVSRRHFDITAEGLRHEIRLVAEKITGVDERLTRESTDIRGDMRQGFEDTQALIRFWHAELDRRILPLEEVRVGTEENVAELQVRVERLEKPTH